MLSNFEDFQNFKGENYDDTYQEFGAIREKIIKDPYDQQSQTGSGRATNNDIESKSADRNVYHSEEENDYRINYTENPINSSNYKNKRSSTDLHNLSAASSTPGKSKLKRRISNVHVKKPSLMVNTKHENIMAKSTVAKVLGFVSDDGGGRPKYKFKIYVCTWNMNACKLPDYDSLKKLIGIRFRPDIIVLGNQEVSVQRMKLWEVKIQEMLGWNYRKVET